MHIREICDIIKVSKLKEGSFVRDSLCLIDPMHLKNDKSYSNIGELFLRSSAVYEYLSVFSADERIVSGNCSDLDLLREFVKRVVENRDTRSRVARGFFRVLNRLLDVTDVSVINGAVSADEIWTLSYEALARKENSLHGIIKKSGITELGVAVRDDGICLPERIGDTGIWPIICPVPSLSELLKVGNSLEAVEERISALSVNKVSGALFLEGFEFEEPNPYVASKAVEKLIAGATLKDKERAILKAQILRRAFLSFGENGGELMIILPSSPNLDTLYHLKRFIDYIDESNLPRVKVILFSPDLVGYSFALSEMAARHKKITVEAAISGNDCCIPRDDEIGYWGGSAPRLRASLAHTAAGLI